MLHRYVTSLVSRPKTVIILVSAITLALGFNISRLKILLDVDNQIPPGHPFVAIGKRAEKAFGGKYMTVLGIYPAEGTVYTPKILGKVKRLTEAVEALPGVKKGTVLSLMSSRVKDIHSTEDALEITPLAPKIPESDAEMAKFRERVRANALLTSLMVSEDGRAAAVFVDFDDFELAGGSAHLFLTLDKIAAGEREPGVEVLVAGTCSILYWLRVYMGRLIPLFVLALSTISYLLYRAFRTGQGMIVPLLTALLCVVWSLGLMGLVGAPMDPWNMMTPILLLAVGAGHSVQILKRYYEEYNRVREAQPELPAVEHNRLAVIEATVKVGVVMIAAGTIAALSFASLAVFGLPSIQSFGLCAAFGIGAALTIELTFIPAMRVLLSPPSAGQAAKEKRREFFDPLLEKCAELVRNRREKPMIFVFVALIGVALVGMLRLEANSSLGAQFFERNAPIRGFRMADSRLVGTRVIQVLIEGQAPDAIKNPKVLQSMETLSDFIAKQPLPIGKVQSLVDVLKLLNSGLMNTPTGKLPDTVESVAQHLLAYSMGGSEEDLSRLVDKEFKNAVITIFLKTDNFAAMKALTDAVTKEANRLFAGLPVKASVGGGVTNAIALNEVMVRGKTINLIQISAFVVLITSILLRSLLGGFLVLLPLATAALLNLGLMGLTGIPLSLATAAISAMAIGIGADYAV
jgi:predicted RND superfamily exporter protein